ncbi:MAG TPA: alkaline phosphatase family protein [Polyangiaceae bacterium]
MGFAAMIAGAAAAACGSSDDSNGSTGNGDDGGGGSDATLAQDGQIVTSDGAVVDGCKTACPTGYTCKAFNGQSACASPDGVPLFDHVFLVMMENISLKTLEAAVDSDADQSGYFKTLASTYAKGSDYHGAHNDAGKAVHPSLPNYIAISSGDYQGVDCDCSPLPEAGVCSGASCNIGNGSCGCNQTATNLADQIETANKTWKAYGEDMGTPCNLKNSSDYAVRHVPFLYFDSIRENATRCTSHVVDFSNLAGDLAATTPNFVYIAPNLTDDGHDPGNPADHSKNIENAAAFLAKMVPTITASDAYKNGGLLVVVWDEDDSSGIFSNDDPIPIYVASPYAKSAFVSSVTADHASLTATIEDGLALPRLGRAKDAKALGDYFE